MKMIDASTARDIETISVVYPDKTFVCIRRPYLIDINTQARIIEEEEDGKIH